MFVAFMLYVLCQQFCSFHHLLCFPDAAMSDALYSDMDALRHQNCLHEDMEALAKDYGLLGEELADHKGILRLCQVCCVCECCCCCVLVHMSLGVIPGQAALHIQPLVGLHSHLFPICCSTLTLQPLTWHQCQQT